MLCNAFCISDGCMSAVLKWTSIVSVHLLYCCVQTVYIGDNQLLRVFCVFARICDVLTVY